MVMTVVISSVLLRLDKSEHSSYCNTKPRLVNVIRRVDFDTYMTQRTELQYIRPDRAVGIGKRFYCRH